MFALHSAPTFPAMTSLRSLRTVGPALLAAALLATSVLTAPGAGAATRLGAVPPGLQQALQQLVDDGVPGAIALERQGDVTARTAVGVADLDTGEPMSPDDRYRIGSITKSFVSTVVLQLEAAGRLSLNDSVAKWLPGVVPNGADITIRELLNHTSGIPNYTDLPFFLQILHDPLHRYSPGYLVNYAVTNYPPVFPPGTGWAYSNTDYILLGMIIAAVDHATTQLAQSFAPPLETLARIIAPLGLLHTSWPVYDPRVSGRHTHGYEINAPAVLDVPPIYDTTVESPTWAWAAGAIISTVDDVARFHRALFGGALLPAKQQQELLDFVPTGNPGLEYGAGVFRLQTPCGPALGHDGGTPAAYTVSLLSPDGARQFEIVTNQDANSFSGQEAADVNNALITGFCGQPPTASAAHAFGLTMRDLRALDAAN
jgi:D-alanyl-D-alanine carboxypeptidase